MKSIKLLKVITFALATITVTATIQPTQSQAGFGHHGKSNDCCVCPSCQHVCKLTAEKVEEEKTCFDVESKVICIPRVVFPWQKKCNPCANNGAKLRTVCVLTTDKYKCPKCEYTWKAEKTGSGDCGSNGCGGSIGCGCLNGCCESNGSCDWSSGCDMIGGSNLEIPQPVGAQLVNATEEIQPTQRPESLEYGIINPEHDAPVAFEYWSPKH